MAKGQSSSNQSVAKADQEQKSLALKDDLSLFDNGSAGLEKVSNADKLIPRITVLQALSPQVTKSKPEYIKGAEAGDFCDTGTGDIFKDSISVLPCFFARVYLEWAPRDSGRGLVANYGTDDSILKECVQDERNRWVLPDKHERAGNYVAETATYYVLNLSAGGRQSFIPMAATALRDSRRWMTLITAQRLTRPDGSEFMPPLYYRSWRLSSVPKSNNEGDWFGWKAEPGETVLELDPAKNLLRDAMAFYEAARDGLAMGDLRDMAEEHGTENSPKDEEAAM